MLDDLQNDNGELMPSEVRPMTKDEILALVTAEEVNARSWMEEVGAESEMALDYYHGKPMGDEEDGSSQVVSNDVCDVIEGEMPDFVRTFCSDDDLIEFEATGDDVEGAALATQYVRHVVHVDNDGFVILHDYIKDGLLTKIGCLKWQWVEKSEPIDRDYSGLSEMTMTALMQDIQAKAGDTEVKILAQEMTLNENQEPVYTLRIRMMRKWGQVEICAVPPDQLRITRGTSAINQSTRYMGHSTTKTRSDLVAMGYPIAEVMELPTYDGISWNSGVVAARFEGITGSDQAIHNKMAEEVEYIEHYVLADADGDGITERLLVVTSGNNVLRAEAVSGLPFSVWSPIRMSHSAIGRSDADLTIDIQRLNTSLLRGTMDNIYSVNAGGRKEVVTGQVNLDDLLTQRARGVVRVKAPGMIRDMPTEFIGTQTMQVMDMVRKMRDERTGVNRNQQGMTAEGLHESTDAAMAMLESLKARVELKMRLCAEGIKHMYAGVLDLIVRHQDQPRQVRINGKVLNIDPAAFKERYGLRVKVGSGNASKDRKRADLEMILLKQGAAMTMGLTTPALMYNTLTDIVALTTQRDGARYFLDPASPEAKQAAAQRQPPVDPLVEAEKAKVAGDMARAAQKDKFDRAERDVEHQETMTEMSLKYGVSLPGSVV